MQHQVCTCQKWSTAALTVSCHGASLYDYEDFKGDMKNIFIKTIMDQTTVCNVASPPCRFCEPTANFRPLFSGLYIFFQLIVWLSCLKLFWLWLISQRAFFFFSWSQQAAVLISTCRRKMSNNAAWLLKKKTTITIIFSFIHKPHKCHAFNKP